MFYLWFWGSETPCIEIGGLVALKWKSLSLTIFLRLYICRPWITRSVLPLFWDNITISSGLEFKKKSFVFTLFSDWKKNVTVFAGSLLKRQTETEDWARMILRNEKDTAFNLLDQYFVERSPLKTFNKLRFLNGVNVLYKGLSNIWSSNLTKTKTIVDNSLCSTFI